MFKDNCAWHSSPDIPFIRDDGSLTESRPFLVCVMVKLDWTCKGDFLIVSPPGFVKQCIVNAIVEQTSGDKMSLSETNSDFTHRPSL